MPGRTLTSNLYRYGFNGKEKDESGEFGGLTHYDYGFRIYNPGISRFLSVDPLTKSYPMLTPYQFASNSPIWGADLDGLEIEFRHVDKNGNSTLLDTDNYITIETTQSGLDNFHGVTYQSVNTYGVIEVDWLSNTMQIEAERQRIASQKSKNRKAAAELSKAKARNANPLTYAPLVAEELAEIPMLAVYGVKGIITDDYTDFKFQAAGILLPGITKTTLKSIALSPKYVDEVLPDNYKDFQIDFELKSGKIEFDGKQADTWYSFVIKEDGTLNIGPNIQGTHFKLADGESSVKAAGKIQFAKNGLIKSVNNSSGHFGTGLNKNRSYTDNVLDAFERAGLIDEMDRIIYGKSINQSHDFPDSNY